jgi:hypothetical protein
MATYLNIKMLVKKNRFPRKYLEIISVKSVRTMFFSESKGYQKFLPWWT